MMMKCQRWALGKRRGLIYSRAMKFLTAVFFLFAATLPSLSASSEWEQVDGAKIRLIGMPSVEGRHYKAGLQIVLEDGWKTYWRNPGGSGLPPQLNFSASTNVRSTDIKFPVPRFFPEDHSIGYKTAVTFPITVEPAIAGLPMKLNVVGLVGICSEICIPTQIDISMKTGATAGTDFSVVRALNEAASQIPVASHKGLKVESVRLADDGKKFAIVEAAAPNTAQEISLFVEGPSALYLTRGTLSKRSGTNASFIVDLRDAKDLDALVGTEFAFTLRADNEAIEQTATIEAATQ